jgi:hypothetical protein
MYDRKFDFAVIYFTNELISVLTDDGTLQKNYILPEKLRYIILQIAQNNYEATGTLNLSKEQMIKAMDKANQISVGIALDTMVKDGMIEYEGINPVTGEYSIKVLPSAEDISDEIKQTNPATVAKIIETIRSLQHPATEVTDNQ